MRFLFIDQQFFRCFYNEFHKDFTLEIMFHFLDGFKINKILPVDSEELFIRDLFCNLSQRLGKLKLLFRKSNQMRYFIMNIEIGYALCRNRRIFLIFKNKKITLTFRLIDFLKQ